jgi:hypothetical protein
MESPIVGTFWVVAEKDLKLILYIEFEVMDLMLRIEVVICGVLSADAPMVETPH